MQCLLVLLPKEHGLAGNADIDILIKFPLDTTEKYLKEFGLKIGHETIKKMEGSQKKDMHHIHM